LLQSLRALSQHLAFNRLREWRPSVTSVVCGHIIVKKWKTAHDSLHLMWYVAPRAHKSVPQMTSWSVQPFLHGTSVWPTHRQTHRPPMSDQQEISNNLGRGCVALPSVTLRHPSPQKCPSRGEVVSPFTTLGVTDPPPRTASQSTQPFLQNTRSLPMNRQTDRSTDSTDTELSMYQ